MEVTPCNPFKEVRVEILFRDIVPTTDVKELRPLISVKALEEMVIPPATELIKGNPPPQLDKFAFVIINILFPKLFNDCKPLRERRFKFPVILKSPPILVRFDKAEISVKLELEKIRKSFPTVCKLSKPVKLVRLPLLWMLNNPPTLVIF